MKRFLTKASKTFVIPKPFAELASNPVNESSASPSSARQASLTPHTATVAGIQPAGPALQPKDTVPPVPHPYPHDHLELRAHSSGLLIRPHITDETQRASPYYVRIAWGKHVRIVEVSGASDIGPINWDGSVVVYGIIGVLDLFSGNVSPPFRPPLIAPIDGNIIKLLIYW